MSIYKNSNGNPLKNSIGNVLCTNYVTGYSFQGTASVNCITGQPRSLSLTFPYTVELFVSGIQAAAWGARNGIFRIVFNSGLKSTIGLTLGGVCAWDESGVPNGISSSAGIYHFIFRNTLYAEFYKNGVYVYTGADPHAFGSGLVSSVAINSNTYGSNGSNIKLSESRLYNRELSVQEMKEIAKLGAYNDVIYPQNLELRYKFDVCEAVDISAAYDGSNLVAGIKDFSGFNRHLQMNGLPAGTLQSKIDYANAYYII